MYIHQYIIDDPLIPLSLEPSAASEVFGKAMGLSPSPFDKEDLAVRLRFLKRLAPMVAADFVKLLPISTAFEPEKELPMFCSETQFSDGLPRVLMEKFHARAEVRSMKKSGNGYLITHELFPCRHIHVGFQGYPVNDGMMYTLYDGSLSPKGDTEFGVRMRLPEVPPSLPYFKAWVNQSINRTAISVHNEVLTEVAIAASLDAVYSTRSELVYELLSTVIPTGNTIPTNTANVFLNIDLPFLADIDVTTLMRVRRE